MKRIVICTDGTWNKPDQEDRGKRKPSNVVKIARGVVPLASDGTHQVVYYDEGVGTQWGLDRFIGGGFGRGLSENVIQAYQFLIHNFVDGDEIYLFGFSRGAYTARSLAGLLNLIGLLPKTHAFYLPEGYALYRDKARGQEAQSFRTEHLCRTVRVKVIGVWDTVGTLGVPFGPFKWLTRGKYEFHDVSLAPIIENAYHALAIDEKRKPFAPSLWQKAEGSTQTLEQVWFAGVHTNIGGGYEKDGLANIALHWMKEKAKQHGLEFDEAYLKPYRPWFGHELRKSYKGIYRLMCPHVRPIGAMERGHESVHESVNRRMKRDASYRPVNVKAFKSKSAVPPP